MLILRIFVKDSKSITNFITLNSSCNIWLTNWLCVQGLETQGTGSLMFFPKFLAEGPWCSEKLQGGRPYFRFWVFKSFPEGVQFYPLPNPLLDSFFVNSILKGPKRSVLQHRAGKIELENWRRCNFDFVSFYFLFFILFKILNLKIWLAISLNWIEFVSYWKQSFRKHEH